MTTPVAVGDALIEGRYAELGEYTVALERFPCQLTFRSPDHEETYGEGDAYYAPPGYLPLITAGTSLAEFSPAVAISRPGSVDRVLLPGTHGCAARYRDVVAG